MTPRLDSFLGLSLGGFHRVAYWDWGPVDAERTVVCVHGLTRQGRDFDALAQVLVQSGWRVVCPDLVGRGRSAWLRNPAGYTLLQYGADMNALLARLDVKAVDWIGTSLGGLVGMILAAQPDSPIRRLVINDIGPFIPNSALRRLGAYLDDEPRFADPPRRLPISDGSWHPTASWRRISGGTSPSTASIPMAGTVATDCTTIRRYAGPSDLGASAVSPYGGNGTKSAVRRSCCAGASPIC
jgi:pimeloyl-ACP methyl ester carboxylesterase